jgi:hypothetical protein
MKNLNVRRNVQKRNFFQNVLKRSQKINVNVQNSIFDTLKINKKIYHIAIKIL